MKYPISYVFVTEDDHHEAFSHNQTSSSGSYPSQVVHPKTNPLYSSLLTPPMSPNDDHIPKDKSNKSSVSNSILAENDSSPNIKIPNCASSVTQSICVECCTSVSSDKYDENSVLWDFQDPSTVFKCVCSR